MTIDPAEPEEILDDSAQFGTLAFYAAIGRAFLMMCAFVPVLYLIELVDYLNDQGFDRAAGIVPRRPDGLDGILFAPFLHGSFAHLAANSVPLLLLGTFVLASGLRRFLYVTGFVMLISGIAVWLTADAGTVTVGASGVIFGYLGFLLCRGLAERSWWSIAVAVLAGILFGWQIIGVLPGDDGRISWQAHLFGFLAGCVSAFLFRPGGLGLRDFLAARGYDAAEADDDYDDD